jgi:acetyl/propionyl-CoA carboxylase alpha subunit
MAHAFEIDGQDHEGAPRSACEVALSRSAIGYRLHRDGRQVPFTIRPDPHEGWIVEMAGRRRRVVVATDGDDVHLHLDGETYRLRHRHPLDRLAAQRADEADRRIVAPMPGAVVALHASRGDVCQRGQQLMVMESMKMETAIVAPRDGVIAEVHVLAGQTFERGAVLLTLEAQGGA